MMPGRCPASRLPPDPVFVPMNASIGFDWRLAPYDVEQSRAHATMLAATGIITDSDRDELLSGLDRVAAELDAGEFQFLDSDEDIHMAVERRLTEIVGAVGGKLHTARSRNDQVATDMAMFTRAHALRAIEALQRPADRGRAGRRGAPGLADAGLHAPAARAAGLPLAPPAGLLLDVPARRAALRGRARLDHRAAAWAPGALAGVNFPTDRRLVASELGFAGVVPNSIDAVSNRDFVLDFLSAAATCATHLSRLGAEIVLWSSEEFGFCEVRDAWASSSSIMPQKKNPDAAELLRAKAPRIVAHLAALHGVMHGAPADLQQGHAGGQGAPLRRGRHAGAVAGGGARDARRDRVQARAPGRRGHRRDARRRRRRRHARQARRAVPAVARDRRGPGPRGGRPPGARSPSSRARSSQQHSDVLDDEFYAVLSQGSWLESKESEGGTSLDRVREQLAHARAALDSTVLEAVVLRPAGAGGRAGPARLRGRRTADCAGVIVETEAYHFTEPACHAYVRRHAAHARSCTGRPGRPTSTAPTASTRC